MTIIKCDNRNLNIVSNNQLLKERKNFHWKTYTFYLEEVSNFKTLNKDFVCLC